MSLHDLTRRDFVKTSAAAIGAASLPSVASALQNQAAPAQLRVLQIGVGGIGGMDRGNIARHPRASIVGLVDVDSNTLQRVAGDFPDAFTASDYRQVFADRADEFDAVNVCTPDHSHAPMVLTALAHDKHCYAQKPLVQQLEELTMIENAIAAKPGLATQIGNQRMNGPGRRIATDILRRNLLGRVIEARCWTSTRRGKIDNANPPAVEQPPEHLDWDLWLGPAAVQPYRPGIAPNHWRQNWDFGTGGMGDWGVHLIDVIMYAYPELTSPIAVQTHTPRAASWFHTTHCQTTLTYQVDSQRFTNDHFNIYYSDSSMGPSPRSLGIHKDNIGSNVTCLVCEEGVLIMQAGGNFEIWRNGSRIDPADLGEIPDVGEYNHWNGWIDRALGDENATVWTPMDVGLRITEASILGGKASKFPGKELLWDRGSLTFTNSQEATDTIVRREYRDGFGPPAVG